MDTYPAFAQAEGTEPKMRGGIMIRTATNGQTRPRALTSGLRTDWSLVHLALTPTELGVLYVFHEAHRGIAFDVELWAEDRTIACVFADPPFTVHPYLLADGKRYRVTVNLIQQT